MEQTKILASVASDTNAPNPFTDSLGILYAISFVAVAIAGWRTGMRHVVGELPLWAVIAALLAAGCVLMHSVRWSAATYACPLAVAWAFLALAMLGADIGTRIYPNIASLTPLADAAVLQWGGIVMTIGFGGAAVLNHFQTLLNGRSLGASAADDNRSAASIVSVLRASGE
ncbi:hypothetical protein [Paraburkholderia sacchari]|uniref:hypothetical protein n=1 Tax=Paraburkholderia sacchari TaxID=159450 RepID=UPI000543830E|nr:hypothetical protein [Paraburkholderia sacchari]NLP65553.1 hypothetical protein [Paraburkholderia sacchari]